MTGRLSEFGSRLSGALQLSHDAEIGLAAGACTLFIAVLAVPFAKYVFLLFFALLSITILATMIRNGEGAKTLALYVRLFWPVLLVAATFAAAIMRTSAIPPGLAKEALAVVIVLFFGLLFLRVLRTAEDLAQFQDVLSRQMSQLAAVVVVLCLVKFFLVLNEIPFGPLMTAPGGRYPTGSALLKDYNYFSLSLLLAFIAICAELWKEEDRSRSLWLQFLLVMVVVSIMFTSSRRGAIVLVALNGLLLAVAMYHNFVRQLAGWTMFFRNLRWYAVLAYAIAFLMVLAASSRGPGHGILMKGLGLRGDAEARFLSRYSSIVKDDPAGRTQLADTRASRYLLASNIYFKEYSTGQKLIGDGFSFIERYADTYRERNELGSGGTVDYDYPHNPLLSALLSGGLLGCAAFLYYLISTAGAHVRTWPATSFFAVWQGILLLFGFFSGNTIFSTPWFIVIAFLPVIVQHARNREGSRLHQTMPAGTA